MPAPGAPLLERLRGEGFEQIVEGAMPHGIHRILDRPVGGQQDHRRLGLWRFDLPEQIEAADLRHAHVGDDKLEILLLQSAQGLDAACRAVVIEYPLRRSVSLIAISICGSSSTTRISSRMGSSPIRPRWTAVRSCGKTIVKSVPPFTSLSTSMKPECRSTIWCTTDKPSPVPFLLVVKKGSKIRAEVFRRDAYAAYPGC